MAQFVGGRYQLIAQLGGGGMADVYLAKLTGKADFAKLAVVKRLKPIEDEDPDILKMFADEARICARLNHPSIVQTFEVGEDTTGPFLVMEYLEGQPLGRIRSRATRREKPIPRAVALKILRDIIGALNYAHTLVDHDGTALTVVHRDVSPENIMVTYAGLTKLVDFGVAKTTASMSRTRAGVLKGKVAYMAPEQARSDTNIDGRADVFAAGLILWELLANKRLWEGFSEAKVFERLLDKDPLPRARSVEADIPQDLDDVCAKAISKEKEDRYDTAADFLDALEAACSANGLRASDREIGQFVSSLFENEREKVKALVSGSMAKPRDGEVSLSGEPLPQANRGSLDPTAPPKEESDPIMWRSLSSGSVSSPMIGSGSTEGSSMPAAETPVAVAETRHTAPIDMSPARSRAPMIALGIVALFGLVGIAVLVGTRLGTGVGPDKATPTTVVATQAPTPSSAAAPEPPPEVSIDVSVKPANAKLYIDGKLASSNPYHLKVVRGEANHEIRAEAEGHDARSMVVAFDRDRALDLVLVRSYEPPTVARNTPPAPPPVVPHQPPPVHTTPPTPPPAHTTTPSSSKGGISEIDPSKPKTGKQDKIDTDVFRR